MRLIDADKIQEYLLDKYHGAISDSEMKIYQLLRLLDEQPTIETLPVVRGEWIPAKDPYDRVYCYRHAGCGCEHNEQSAYCPNCGCDMRGERDGEK